MGRPLSLETQMSRLRALTDREGLASVLNLDNKDIAFLHVYGPSGANVTAISHYRGGGYSIFVNPSTGYEGGKSENMGMFLREQAALDEIVSILKG